MSIVRWRIPVVATIVMLIAFFVLCALGTWQVQRMHWKSDLLEKLTSEYSKDAGQINLELSDFQKKDVYIRGSITGEYHNDKSFLLGPRMRDGKAGFHIIVPFLMAGQNKYILVNRGWVPRPEDMDKGAVMDEPLGTVKIVGMVREPQGSNMFTPSNQPLKAQWYSLDFKAVESFSGLSVIGPSIFYAEGPVRAQIYPYPHDNKITLNNNHAQYAIFWYTMAFVLLVIYAVRFYVRPCAQ